VGNDGENEEIDDNEKAGDLYEPAVEAREVEGQQIGTNGEFGEEHGIHVEGASNEDPFPRGNLVVCGLEERIGVEASFAGFCAHNVEGMSSKTEGLRQS